MQTLKLKEGIIYGPVNSRRLGFSLGINLLATKCKMCTFDCVYCHYGWTKAYDDIPVKLSDIPVPDQVQSALEHWFKENQTRVDYITFSGNGEPTLHPDFYFMVDVALRARKKLAPQAKLAILSNSTCLDYELTVAGLRKLDVRIMKLDCGTEETFKKLNRPRDESIRFDRIVENLKKLDDIIIQSIFVEGSVNNTEKAEVDEWIRKLKYIKPKEVQIYSIDRPTADSGLSLVTKDKLNQIAKKAQEVTGISVKVF